VQKKVRLKKRGGERRQRVDPAAKNLPCDQEKESKKGYSMKFNRITLEQSERKTGDDAALKTDERKVSAAPRLPHLFS